MARLLESLKEVKSLYNDEFELEKNGLSVSFPIALWSSGVAHTQY